MIEQDTSRCPFLIHVPRDAYNIHIWACLSSTHSELYQLMSGCPYQDMDVHVTSKLQLRNALDIIVESC